MLLKTLIGHTIIEYHARKNKCVVLSATLVFAKGATTADGSTYLI